ncbi:MAG: RCC1 domain-containing protein, partial [Lepagella sp.]
MTTTRTYILILLLTLLCPALLRAGDKKAIATGYRFCLVLKQDGSLWAFGRNDLGQLGDGTKQYRSEPVKVLDHVKQMSAGECFSMALLEDGTLWTWGDNGKGQLGDGTTQERRLRPQKIMDGISSIDAGD